MEEIRKYDNYKDSGIEWISEIPEHWECKMIKRLSPVKRGASPRPIDNPIYFDNNGEYSWVRIADVSASERYLENTEQILSELGASLSVKRNPGDFFLSIAGTVGKPIISKIKCCIHDVFVYFPDLKINPEFLYYLFTTGLPYKGLGKWGTQLNLNTDTVGEIYIPVPLETEIESLVSFLDRKTAEIDQIITNKQKLLALYEEEKQAIINQAVTKGLDPNVKLKDSGVEWLGKIPEHWGVKKLKYFVNLITEKAIGDNSKIGLENIESKTGKYIETNTEFEGEGIAFVQNDILYGKLRPYLAKVWIAEFEGAAVGDFFVIRMKDNLCSEFIKYRLLSTSFTDVSNGSTFGAKMPRVSWEFMSDLFFAIPAINEQQCIVTHIEKECARLDTIIEKFNKQIDLLQEYRTTLISEVVTGKIKVC